MREIQNTLPIVNRWTSKTTKSIRWNTIIIGFSITVDDYYRVNFFVH